ncbi:hypothetical protein COCON_G00187210 [Conger conger]|uniref:Uncharacterized protein n=1 Tax=Conger conger TaxID=82655 RepID=A0A9Q1D320_CONCO|nr:hypothetical protein COCON_G00187210 [Conger conger]
MLFVIPWPIERNRALGPAFRPRIPLTPDPCVRDAGAELTRGQPECSCRFITRPAQRPQLLSATREAVFLREC